MPRAPRSRPEPRKSHNTRANARASAKFSNDDDTNVDQSLNLHAELLQDNSDLILSVDIDFGTSSTSAVFAVIDKNSDPTVVECVEKAKLVRTRNHDFRLPTPVALRPDDDNEIIGRLLFASDASAALEAGVVSVSEMFPFAKLGLKKSDASVHEEDKEDLAVLQERLDSVRTLGERYSRIEAVYPDKPDQKHVIELQRVEDVIHQILRYFLGLFKVNVGFELGFSMSEVEVMFRKENIECAFAVPSIWSDLDIGKFVSLIEKAGWPTNIKLWSKAKTAAIAHIAHTYARAKTEKEKVAVRDAYLRTAIVLCDIGGGTLDLTTIMAAEIEDERIKFASVAASSGSLCGGCVLDLHMKNETKKTLGANFDAIKRHASGTSETLDDEDFLHAFRYIVSYGGHPLPRVNFPTLVTQNGVYLTSVQLVRVHDQHIARVLELVRQQISLTRKEKNLGSKALTVALCGGVAHTPYTARKIISALRSDKVDVKMIERPQQSLVALGCLLCLRQLNIGGRTVSPEALGIPIAVESEENRHADRNKTRNGRAGYPAEEATDIPNWIVNIGDPTQNECYMDEITLSHAFFKDDNTTPMTSDPRKHDLVIDLKFDILSTTQDDEVQQWNSYKAMPEIYLRRSFVVRLERDQWEQIAERAKWTRTGFFRDDSTCQWFFATRVRILIDWPDLRVRFRVVIPKEGHFERPRGHPAYPPIEHWDAEVIMAVAADNGLRDGDKLLRKNGEL